MSGARGCLGQAVVTDPGEGRSSGYVLVAASPGVAPEDARHLSLAPQVTDHLHLAESPGPYHSFYPLPSGAWAAVRRFVHGRRRGSFNRVVVHTLVVAPELLRELADEPWLLWTSCRFRSLDADASSTSAEQTPAELAERASEPGLRRLPDLECALAEPRAERLALLRRRLGYLRRAWGDTDLAGRLGAVFAARAAGRRLLLPQGAGNEQFLSLAWSALPWADRLETPWTTHLAPAAGGLFALAAGPDPRALRAAQDEPGVWLLPFEEAAPADAEGGSEVLARFLLAAEADLAALEEGFRELGRQGLRLRESARIRRFVARLEAGAAGVREGFAEVTALERFFHGLRRGSEEELDEPWLRPPQLLASAALSVLALHAGGRELGEAEAAVDEVLAATRWRAALLSPAVAAELAASRPEVAGRAVAVAAALALRGLPSPPSATAEREAWSRLLLASPPENPAAHPSWAATLRRLALDLGRSASTSLGSVLERLSAQPGELARLAAALEPEPIDLPTMRAVLAAAVRSGDDEVAARVAAAAFLPLLARLRPFVEVESDEIEAALAALARRPDVTAAVLGEKEAETVLRFETAALEFAHFRGGLALDRAVALAAARIRRAATRSGLPAAFHLLHAVERLLPKGAGERLAALVELLLSPRIPPAAKRCLETEMLDRDLARAGDRLPEILPPVRALAARGPLLLRVAARLGRRWSAQPPAAERFVREASLLGRYDAVAAFLDAAESGGPSFLEHLSRSGGRSLVGSLRRTLAENATARGFWRPYQLLMARERR